MGVKQYPKEVEQHKNQWVALSAEDKVVGFGKTPVEATESAKAAGHTKITLIFVPDEWPKLMML